MLDKRLSSEFVTTPTNDMLQNQKREKEWLRLQLSASLPCVHAHCHLVSWNIWFQYKLTGIRLVLFAENLTSEEKHHIKAETSRRQIGITLWMKHQEVEVLISCGSETNPRIKQYQRSVRRYLAYGICWTKLAFCVRVKQWFQVVSFFRNSQICISSMIE